MNYRILELKGTKTSSSKFYIQREKKKLFRKEYKWVNVKERHLSSGAVRNMVFPDLGSAENWINKKTESYERIYHIVK